MGVRAAAGQPRPVHPGLSPQRVDQKIEFRRAVLEEQTRAEVRGRQLPAHLRQIPRAQRRQSRAALGAIGVLVFGRAVEAQVLAREFLQETAGLATFHLAEALGNGAELEIRRRHDSISSWRMNTE